MEMLNLYRATEPCYLKSTDCVAKLNTKFLLIAIKPWLIQALACVISWLHVTAFPPPISRANAVVLG